MADERDDQQQDEQRGVFRRIAEAAARRDGAEVVDQGELEIMESEVRERRALRKELDLIAWQALDYVGGNEQDLQAVHRRKLVQQARVAWQQDPQLGAAIDLMNDFALGRGVPKPQARDQRVQEIIDEAWEDEDNQLVLTSYPAQLALGTDLSLQSNLFLLLFTGDDGRVKLGLLEHDTVENVVRDPDNRRRILYYVSRRKRVKWDYTNDAPQTDGYYYDRDKGDRVVYYQHWRNEPSRGQKAPAAKMGKGRVYHIAVNKTSEMAFGHPTMHRVLRWANAFNTLMESRVDAAKAAAAFIMKRKVKGTPNQIRKLATQALSKRGELGRSVDQAGEDWLIGPRSGSTITENEQVEHESFKLDSGSQNANVDGQMIRSQISAATHFPQHYLGDIGSANLATATSMELPVLKSVESRQEIFEQLFRWFIDRTIEEAVRSGRLSEELSPEELAEREAERGMEGTDEAPPTPSGQAAVGATPASEVTPETPPVEIGAVEDGTAAKPEDSKRDLSYEFGLPSPLRRMMGELTNAVSTIARTFDPNGTNIELSRTLLSVALGEGLEMEDPASVVDKVFPPGYKDPAMAALEAQQAAQQQGPAGPEAPSIQVPGAQNPYGMEGGGETPYGPPGSAAPEDAVQEATTRADRPATEKLHPLTERLSDEAKRELRKRRRESRKSFRKAADEVRED